MWGGRRTYLLALKKAIEEEIVVWHCYVCFTAFLTLMYTHLETLRAQSQATDLLQLELPDL